MAKVEITTKRLAIGKANAQMVGIVAAASFITVFSLVASHAVLTQNQYLGRLTKAKTKAHTQLQSNIKAFDNLVTSYKAFDSTATNVIGGNSIGSGDNDGTNSRIILDALPSTYDFPALTSSIEKIISLQGLKLSSITGTDDQVAQGAVSTSPTPQPVAMPFSFSVSSANYDAINKLTTKLQQSIRPIQIDSLDIEGGGNSMTATFNAHTSYQPGKNVNITKKLVP